MLITTPRVFLSLSWQIRTRLINDSSALRSSVSIAIFAAAAALAPCPKPSTTATSAPLLDRTNTCRSPVSVWPGSALAATPHSTLALAIFSIFLRLPWSHNRPATRFLIHPSTGARRASRDPGCARSRSHLEAPGEYRGCPVLDHVREPSIRAGRRVRTIAEQFRHVSHKERYSAPARKSRWR